MKDTIVWRHRKENLKKCSLRGLEHKEGFSFCTYPTGVLPDLSGYLLLSVDAPPLTYEDREYKGLFLIDATWRYAEKMAGSINIVEKRSIPRKYQTAYPRRQDEAHGLASIEAIFVAYHILGLYTGGLLDDYYWKDKFLELNPGLR
jgi:pre-rRNA-processing protein TSR3